MDFFTSVFERKNLSYVNMATLQLDDFLHFVILLL